LPAIIALPLWIFAAIRDAIEDGDFDEITSLILNAFAWIILILGEAFSIVTTILYIYWGY
jgi:predicted permease